jgi:hypothetical protein
MGKLARLYFVGGLLLIIGILASDVLSEYFAFFGKLGTLLWFISYFSVAIYALRCLKNLLHWGIKKVSIVTLLTISLFVLIIGMQVGSPASLSGETTIETECALNHLRNADDLGFKKTCLFGYPARQYFLSSLPTILFSRNLINLHLGGSLYFLMGIIVFSYGMFRFFGINKKTDLLVTLSLSTLFHFYYFNHFLFKFEQSIFPLSMGLILAGSLLEYSKKFYKPVLIPITLSIFYLTSSYTPSLALFGLSIVVLSNLVFKAPDKISKALLSCIIVASITLVTGTLLFRNDINLSQSSQSYTQIQEDVKLSAEHLLKGNLNRPFTSIFYRYIFIFLILSSLLGLAGYSGVVFSIWILAVILFAITSKGYIYYALEFRLHRALVTLPVLLYLQAKIVNLLSQRGLSCLPKILIGKPLVVLTFFILLSGLYYNQQFLSNRGPNPHYAYIEWVENNLDTDTESIIYVTHEAGRYNDLISLSDTIRYLLPNIKAVYSASDEVLSEDCTPKRELVGNILIPENHDCYFPLVRLSGISKDVSTVGAFQTTPQLSLVLFAIK